MSKSRSGGKIPPHRGCTTGAGASRAGDKGDRARELAARGISGSVLDHDRPAPYNALAGAVAGGAGKCLPAASALASGPRRRWPSRARPRNTATSSRRRRPFSPHERLHRHIAGATWSQHGLGCRPNHCRRTGGQHEDQCLSGRAVVAIQARHRVCNRAGPFRPATTSHGAATKRRGCPSVVPAVHHDLGVGEQPRDQRRNRVEVP